MLSYFKVLVVIAFLYWFLLLFARKHDSKFDNKEDRHTTMINKDPAKKWYDIRGTWEVGSMSQLFEIFLLAENYEEALKKAEQQCAGRMAQAAHQMNCTYDSSKVTVFFVAVCIDDDPSEESSWNVLSGNARGTVLSSMRWKKDKILSRQNSGPPADRQPPKNKRKKERPYKAFTTPVKSFKDRSDTFVPLKEPELDVALSKDNIF